MRYFLLICQFVLLLGWGGVFAQAYIIDGNLDDWGVTPFTDWVPDSPNIDWREADDTNRYPGGGLGITVSGFNETRDYEAFYADDDDDYIYWAMVSSVPFDPAFSRTSPRPEDLAMDKDGDGIYEFGFKIGLVGARTDNGAPVQNGVYNVTRWRSQSGAPYQIKNGSQIGTYEIFNRYLGSIEAWNGHGKEPKDAGDGWGWTARTYVLEARVSKLLFGGCAVGDVIRMFFAKYECITDYIWVDLTINGGGNNGVIPEPTSLFLIGTGLFGVFGLRRKKSRA